VNLVSRMRLLLGAGQLVLLGYCMLVPLERRSLLTVLAFVVLWKLADFSLTLAGMLLYRQMRRAVRRMLQEVEGR
jgi:hypothetical protein